MYVNTERPLGTTEERNDNPVEIICVSTHVGYLRLNHHRLPASQSPVNYLRLNHLEGICVSDTCRLPASQPPAEYLRLNHM
jgi:hypothetical protein